MFKLYSILIVRKGTSFSNGNENNKINKVSIRIRSLFVFNRYYENQKDSPHHCEEPSLCSYNKLILSLNRFFHRVVRA